MKKCRELSPIDLDTRSYYLCQKPKGHKGNHRYIVTFSWKDTVSDLECDVN